jgi:hypothetical protein
MTATDETPDLHADLPDVLNLVAKLGAAPRLGRDFRRAALTLANAAEDVEHMNGLVIEGEAYNVRWYHEWAVCHCGDVRHEYRKDWPRGRGHWHLRKDDAETELRRAQQQRASWESHRPEPHLVWHLVAETTTEAVA